MNLNSLKARSSSLLKLGSVAFAAVLLPLQSQAVTVFANSPGAGSQTDFVLGMDFVVNNTVSVTDLGVFDSLGNGFTQGQTITVGIFLLSGPSGPGVTGGLIASSLMTFDSASPGVLDGGSRFKSVVPFALAPGNYSIVAGGFDVDASGNSGNGDVTTFNNLGGNLTLVGGGGRWNSGNTFAFPTQNYSGYGQTDPVFLAGTFKATTAAAGVPDGGLTVVMLGMTVTALAWMRRKSS